ncbi:MAG: hypothetical protein IPH20_17410 [Bacteroidales bacterium]|nr:hypothetical protein [Bacteroidales bacterium]
MKNAFILFLVYLFCPFLLHAQDESVDIKFKIQNDELIAGANKNNFSVFATGPDNIVSPASGSFTNAHERTKILRDSSLLYSWDQVKNEWSLKAYYRTKYSYDEKFRLTDCVNYRTDYFSGSVVPTQEYKSVYDSNNNLIYEHRKNFSSDWYSPPSSFDSMEYVNNILTIQKSFVFDPKEKIWISCGEQHFDDLGCRIDNSEIRYAMVYIPPDEQFMPDYGTKSVIRRNRDHQVVENMNQSFDIRKDEWINNTRRITNRKRNGLVKSNLTCAWDTLTSSWQKQYMQKFKQTSDSSAEAEKISWDGMGVEKRSLEIVYFDQGKNLILKKYYQIHGQTRVFTGQSVYTYNKAGECTRQTGLVFKENVLRPYSDYSFGYDDNNHLISKINHSLNTESGKIEYGTRETFFYDSTGTLVEEIYFHWSLDSLSYIPSRKVCYFNSVHTSACNSELPTKSSLVYPDQASQQLYITNLESPSTALVFDSENYVVINCPVVNNRISIVNLSIGMYKIQISNKEGIIISEFLCSRPHENCTFWNIGVFDY